MPGDKLKSVLLSLSKGIINSQTTRGKHIHFDVATDSWCDSQQHVYTILLAFTAQVSVPVFRYLHWHGHSALVWTLGIQADVHCFPSLS